MPHLHQLLNEDDIEQLQSKLAFAEIFSTSSDSDFIPGLTIARKEHTKVRIRPERNHPRAHFHIEYKREHSASYAIDNLERLAGYMPTKYERPILEWAAERRLSLQATWDELAAGKIITELVLSKRVVANELRSGPDRESLPLIHKLRAIFKMRIFKS